MRLIAHKSSQTPRSDQAAVGTAKRARVRTTKRAIVPVWAQRVEVEKRDGEFLIHGWGHLPYYLNPAHPDAKSLDFLEQQRRYGLRQLKSRNGDNYDRSPYQFADAADDDKLENFMSTFGPVWGEVEKVQNEEGTGSFTATVRQNLEELRREQKVFAATVSLIGEVNKKRPHIDPKKLGRLLVQIAFPDQLMAKLLSDPGAQLDMDKLAAMRVPNDSEQEFLLKLTALAAVPQFTGKSPDKQTVIGVAHAVLCQLFNLHPLMLVPVSEQPIELPVIATKGIREALYYTLRLDYLAQRAIGTCLDCRGHFPVSRRGQKGCSELCRRRLRNKRYRAHSTENLAALGGTQ
jgi:hypothetical protein